MAANHDASPVDLDATATAQGHVVRIDAKTPVFPVVGWTRYQPLRFLGQGGMGKVFLARDLRLHRDVAIKFVRGGEPALVHRLVSEARAQARVSHERVCKVYEVGEVEGEVYIAMQYIDGQPLGALAAELSVEQKALLLRDAALGVHEAHRAGIIHRDLKPSNIMVERAEDGALKAYVMDFGLARDWGEGTTETGTVLGTPHFMSPEQARGEVGRLDRRADVYSLGASLYHLLTGAPPIPGSNGLEVLNNVAAVEPRPLRALDPDVPRDLEAIVLKCLEKDRSSRYDSARALAEDLDRFLGGEPVRARAAGLGYRLRKKAQKHRRLVMVAAVALAVVVVALGWGVEAQRRAVQREQLARRFTELVERIEAMARYSALSPLHDITGDQAAIRARMEELEGEIRKAGRVALGPGSYALGRGHLALGEDEKARDALETAWSHAFREPRAAYALALALGHLYEAQLLEAEKIRDGEQREEKKRAIEQRYRDPALAYLKQSAAADVPSTEYVAALVAFYEDRFDEALSHLDAIGGGLPWFYEAPELRGDILLARASKHRLAGERAEAIGDFEAGRRAYTAAGAIGESVPAVHEAIGELEYTAMVMELYGQGDTALPFTRGVAALSRALSILPDHYASLVLESRFYRSMAEQRTNQGGNAEDLLATAVTAAQRAMATSPERSLPRLELSRSFRQWGEYRQGKNQNPAEPLGNAVAISEAVPPADRDYEFYVNLGLIFKVWADYEDQIGSDSQVNRGKAIDAYSRAIDLPNRVPDAWINLGINYYMRASQPRAKDPNADLAQALHALDRARSIEPKHLVPYFYDGEIRARMAQQKRAGGGDPGPDFAEALVAYGGGLGINPRLPHLHNGISTVLAEEAKEAWDHGADPGPLLDQAQAAAEQAIAVAPEQGYGYDNAGEALTLRAYYQHLRGDDPSSSAHAATAALERAIERIPDHPVFWADLGTIHVLVAEHQLTQRGDPRESLGRASAALQKALERNPNEAQAHRYLGEARALLGRFRAGQGRAAADDFAAAAEAFQRAIDLSPENQDDRLAFGRFCRAQAAWQSAAGGDPRAAIQRGLELVAPVLTARPAWAEARVLRASLLLLRAQVTAPGEEQRAEGARAAEDFTMALEASSNLERAWRAEARLAQELAARRLSTSRR